MRIIAIPGLGGFRSVFDGYAALLPSFSFEIVEQVDITKAHRELSTLLQDGESTILLANCYGAQLAVPMLGYENVKGLVIIEPYFAQYRWWRVPALFVTYLVLAVCRLTDSLGLRRRRFRQGIDYRYLSRFPLFIQPLFDLCYQSVTEYALKIRDILTYRFPQDIDVPTLLIFSPGGYARSQKARRQIASHFTRAGSVETSDRTHNIVIASDREIANAITSWYGS